MKRKCNYCKGAIEIDTENIHDVIFYHKLYYHKSCFETMAATKATLKRGKMWQEALDNISEYEMEAKKILGNYIIKDKLNDWLLAHYDIVMVSSRFWQIVADLEQGIYKGKKCRPVTIEMLLSVWKWGQGKLDDIDRSNKVNHRGPQNDEMRLMYDLAIVVGKVPIYLAHKEKQKVAANELARNTSSYDEVDMSKIGQQKKEAKQDISDILNDLYIE